MVLVLVELVVTVIVVWVVCVVVEVGAPTTSFNAGAQIIFGWPTGTFCSSPNWSLRLTLMSLVKAVSLALQSAPAGPKGQVFALIR